MAGNIGLYLLSHLLLLGGLVVQSSFAHLCIFGLIFALDLYIYLAPGATVSDKSVLLFIFVASDYLLITNAQHQLFLESQKLPISEAPFREKLKWAVRLVTSYRGVGWKHEPPAPIIPPRPSRSRSRIEFIISQLSWIFVYCLVQDLAITFIIEPLQRQVATSPSLHIVTLSVHQRCAVVIGYGTVMYSVLSMLYAVLSIASVASKLSAPSDWPHIFGQWGHAHTIRKFWGRTWHQNMRRPCSAHGKHIAHKVFKFKSGTNLSSYTQLYVGFIVSGIVHTYTFSSTIADFDARPLIFFVMQAVAITFEDGVFELFDKSSRSDLEGFPRVVGYAWTFGWFAYTLPLLLDWRTANEYIAQTRLPYSISSWLLRGEL